jgi:AbrB family looped-hinge helix DNA binding protein
MKGKTNEVRRAYFFMDTMSRVVLTKMSTKGQVVIPKAMREELDMADGDVFAVFGKADTIVLRRVSVPTEEEFEELMRWGRDFAERKGITRDDVQKAIDEVREERK